MRAIVRKKKQRADLGRGSIICVRGQNLDYAEVVRYWDRKGVAVDDVIARWTSSPTPEAVEFSTPVPLPIQTPQVLAIPEQMFRCIRNYVQGSFESGSWVKTDASSRCYSIKDGGASFRDLEALRDQCYFACSLFSKNLF